MTGFHPVARGGRDRDSPVVLASLIAQHTPPQRAWAGPPVRPVLWLGVPDGSNAPAPDADTLLAVALEIIGKHPKVAGM